MPEVEQLLAQVRSALRVDGRRAAGEDERPRGPLADRARSGVSLGSSSAKTPHSRIRRAISCEYWPPKSRTSTSSRADRGGATSTVSGEAGSPSRISRAAVADAGTSVIA